MLASWLRMKFPHVFQGALAASAPIRFFDKAIEPRAYYDIATEDYRLADPQCPVSIKHGFELLAQYKSDPSKYAQLTDIFNLCSEPTSASEVQNLINLLDGSLGNMVMVDYPYPSDFLAPLPAWPVDYACTQASQAKEDHKAIRDVDLYAINAAASVFYNYAGQTECVDISNSAPSNGIDQDGWNVLYCNEMPMPFASDPETSMFPPSSWNKTANDVWCRETYGEMPQYDWALDYFGGMNPSKDFMKASNIVFSNGSLDPWHAGGILEQVSPLTTSIYI